MMKIKLIIETLYQAHLEIDIDTHASIEESRHAGWNGITGKIVTTPSSTNGVSDSDVPKGESNGSTKKTDQYPNDGMSVACGGNPGDPSDSDESDSEDDSKKDHAKDDRDENDQNKDRDKERNISDWRIDTEVWKRCIEMKDVDKATRLVNERILPDQDLLDPASEVFDVSSEIVQNICTAICCYMKNKKLYINRVWPALDYRQEVPNKNITFIIYTSQSSESETIEYRCYERSVNEISTSCSNENSHIKELEQDCEKDYSETEKIRECLNKYSKSLMESHKNLTRISISWFKSGGYGTEKQSITPKTCIAVYVQVKGFVPLNETVLPKELDGIVVDVREGVVTSYIGPNEHHEHLKMGCAVHSGLKDRQGTPIGGTLGGFVEINTAVYCISSAHVFLSAEDMEKLKNMGICNLTDDTIIKRFNARQPVYNGSRSFGIGVCAVYKEGGNGETGVEVVIVEVKDRFPISGEFPDCPHNRNPGCDSLKFSSGKLCNREEVNRLIREKKLTVVKFGCISGWTRGIIRLEGGSARFRHMVGTLEDKDEFGMLLYNQYEIESIGGVRFAENGDSGSLVFTDAYGPLSVIGIVEGGMAEVVYVTPICEVFAALNLQENVQNMKVFPPHCPDIQNIPMQTDDSNSSQYLTNRSDSGVSSADGATLCTVEEKLISDVSVLKADITNVKAQVEKTKSDVEHKIDKSNTELQSKMNAMQEQMQKQMKEQMKEQMKQTELLKSFFAQFSPPSPATSTSNTHPS
ncbi:uncharacterized protein LOC128553057 isoform X1 [Mercenaria mercenaria]|uniref:uncharacterized protein LOC128553057 isoform X1 n=1 Tax=Mercenaria mercenaria TaxID=6596 RepID=UPI00234F92CC|nr:uncharacterized protein LOC128553057 isoform X1 [Mercenaria mercenaria]